MDRIIKHRHGTPNPIIAQEEEALIATVNRSLASTSNAQTIGRNGELPIRDFFNRYLPYTLRAATGHFVPPSGKLSPQIDVMILDSRYPLLSQNPDGSVLAPLHSVVATIEVKTKVSTRDIRKMWGDARRIMLLSSEVEGYGAVSGWRSVQTYCLAYGCTTRLDTLEAKYEEEGNPDQASLDMYVLRLLPKEQVQSKPLGAMFHFEPRFESDESSNIIGWFPMCLPQFTPLSDLYYNLVQTSYHILGDRDHDFSDIGNHLVHYMAWTTCSWKKYYEMKQ